MIIGGYCFNSIKKDFVIENYPNLEMIVVNENSLMFLNSLKICNCEKLKIFEVYDGYQFGYSGAFNNVKTVIIESI